MRREDRVDAGTPRLSPPGDRRGSDGLMKFYDAGRARWELRARHRAGAARGAGQPEVHLPRRARSRRRDARCAVSRQRPRARVAAVVLPVEQHSGRRAAGCGEPGTAAPARRCSSAQVRRMLADPRAQALVDEFRRPVAARPQPAEHDARQERLSRTSTTTCGRRSSASWSCSSAASSARIAACSI